MLTGQSPVPDGTVAAKLVFHQTQEPRSVLDFRKDVPDGMLAVLKKMMAKKPADRYQTPLEVAEALADYAHAEVEPPPIREMPDLCPAVMMLSGHSNTPLKVGAAAKQSGFGYGGLAVVARGGGSSVQLARPGVSSEPLTPSNATVRLDDLSQAQVPTARSGGTAPLNTTPPGAPGLGMDDSEVRVSPFPKESRTAGPLPPNFTAPVMPDPAKPWLVIALGVAIVALIAVAVAVFLTRT